MSITHIPPGEGKLVWIGDSELVSLKERGKDTRG